MDKLLIQRNLHKKVKEIVFKEIKSTQVYCRENYNALLSKEKMWHLVVAEAQTAGIGQADRKWDSPSNNIYCTFVIPIKSSFLMYLTFIPLITVHSIAKVLKAYGIDPKVKWINDVLVNNKKIAGTLCESYTIGDESVVLIGIGINTNLTQEEIDAKDIDQEITSLAVEMQNLNLKNFEKHIKENEFIPLNYNTHTNENFTAGAAESAALLHQFSNIQAATNSLYDGMFSFNRNVESANFQSALNGASSNAVGEKDKDNNTKYNENRCDNSNEIKIAAKSGIYTKRSGAAGKKKFEIENKVLIESLKNEIYTDINKVLHLDSATPEQIDYECIKLNFTVFTLNPLHKQIAYLNKNVLILNTQFNNRAIFGRFLGLDDNGFAKIKEKTSNEVYTLIKGRLQSIRSILITDVWNNKESLKVLEFTKIKFNNEISFWNKKHFGAVTHNSCSMLLKMNNNKNTINKSPNSEDHENFYYVLEGTVTDRLGNKLAVYGDLIEPKEILHEEEKEIFKINLFFDLEKSKISSDVTGYVDKDHHLEGFCLKKFYSLIYLRGVFNPEKQIICFSYSCDNKEFNVMNFVKYYNNYNNKLTQSENDFILNVDCTEIYERTVISHDSQ